MLLEKRLKNLFYTGILLIESRRLREERLVPCVRNRWPGDIG